MSGAEGDITSLLHDLRDGHPEAMERLVPLVYDNLRVIARRNLRRIGGVDTLDATGLVHEAYLRLVGRDALDWNDRRHFYAVFSRVMRNLVVDHARARGAVKRGGDRVQVTLTENAATVEEHADQILAIDSALETIEKVDPRLVRVVECRFFAGLSEIETAHTLQTSERTVRRDWQKVRGLMQEILAD
jgi:RNA polymerase sigma factor (TIGR02999 family)